MAPQLEFPATTPQLEAASAPAAHVVDSAPLSASMMALAAAAVSVSATSDVDGAAACTRPCDRDGAEALPLGDRLHASFRWSIREAVTWDESSSSLACSSSELAAIVAAVATSPAVQSPLEFFVSARLKQREGDGERAPKGDEKDKDMLSCTVCDFKTPDSMCGVEAARHLVRHHQELLQLHRRHRLTSRDDITKAVDDAKEKLVRSKIIKRDASMDPQLTVFLRNLWSLDDIMPQHKNEPLSDRSHRIPTTMTGICIAGDAKPALMRSDLPVPVPKPNEALIRVLRAGICGTDLAMINNYKPGFQGALGHEFVGIVECVGESNGETSATDVSTEARVSHGHAKWIGKRVVGEINIPCNDVSTCHVCRAYHTASPSATTSSCSSQDSEATSAATTAASIRYRNHCPNRHAVGIVGRDGAFAQYMTLPLANLLVVPDSVSDAIAVFVEPLAAAWRVVEQRIVRATDRVVVLGDGRLGLLVAEVLATEQLAQSVTLVGKHADKIALLNGVVDAAVLYDATLEDAHRGEFDVCVECTGTASGLACALQLVRGDGRGRVVLKSTCATPSTPLPTQLLARTRSTVAIIGSRCGPFAPALRALQQKRVDVSKYLAAAYPLARADAALAHARTRGTLKVQLVMPEPTMPTTP